MTKAVGLMLVATAVAAAVSMAAVAQSPTAADVARRQHDMKEMAGAAKSINAMFKGSAAYDAKAFKAAAETILALSGTALTSLFENSTVAPESKAGANIEGERQQFDKLAADLATYASALSVAADQHPDTIGPRMRMQAGDDVGGGPIARKVDTRKRWHRWLPSMPFT